MNNTSDGVAVVLDLGPAPPKYCLLSIKYYEKKHCPESKAMKGKHMLLDRLLILKLNVPTLALSCGMVYIHLAKFWDEPFLFSINDRDIVKRKIVFQALNYELR